ncbi:MAG TPA: outer membrane lipid asymmetry maintenance protein MlaD [Verrucomicrobiae bacterium]|nr:outer membrane lipid asymmetry maintenance protein MlaD [Verrucomicrobiae bacterium]
MKRARIELVVGIFMLVGMLCLGWLSVRLGRMEIFGGSDYYRVSADFDSASGLKPGAPVEIAGVQVGKVDRIRYDQERKIASVELAIGKGITLYDDDIAAVRTSGIIGDKYIKVKPGGAGAPVQPGAKLRETESALDLEEILAKFIHGKVD